MAHSVTPGLAQTLVSRFGSPLYVYDALTVQKRAQELKTAFKGLTVHYAVKANANPALLELIKNEELGAEAVSPGEILIARRAGFKKQNISFTGPNLSETDLRFAAEHAGRVHLDSLTQLEIWGRLRLGNTVSLRVNLGIGAGHHEHVRTGGDGSKFGITEADFPRALQLAKKLNVRITGLQQHIGSHVPDGSDYVEGARLLLKAAEQFPDIAHIDFGGGLPIPYEPKDKRVNLGWIGRELQGYMRAYAKRTGRTTEYAIEPGRYVVAEAGTLLVTVTDVKQTAAHVFVGVNSGFNHLIRPALYGSYHDIENLSRTTGQLTSITVAGNVCESGDVFAWDREGVVPQLGDILAIRDVGAYGISMASTYNLRPLPREILISEGTLRDISFNRTPFLIRS
ncbi:MAG TPA: diaminopimelate decarboxylase [Candidatus Paceibacterota bacterium]|nr:diaminopimelate decarboxylase [Candidatus Paceibacterota bacterium]